MPDLQIWIGFSASIAGILIISRKNLPLAIISGGLILGLITLRSSLLVEQFIKTVSDPEVIFLTLAMGLIPVIGGVMKDTGQIDSLVNNIRIPQRYMLPMAAALMGLLPMPGGALLSAPVVQRAGDGVSAELKAVVNNWYRHIFILIYPLAPALIVATGISGLDIYECILYLLPAFVVSAVLGWVFFLRKINGRRRQSDRFNMAGLMKPLLVILTAPVVDFALKRTLELGSLATLIGVMGGLGASLLVTGVRINPARTFLKMKAWNFALIIVGMFFYLHVFVASGAGDLLSALPLPPLYLAMISGLILSFLTGRVQLPATIILPAYIATGSPFTPFIFALIYTVTYFGYIISPVHPCLIVTCEFFGISIRSILSRLAWPTALVVLFVFITLAIFT